MKTKKKIGIALCVCAAILLPLALSNNDYYLSLFGQTLINIIIVCGLNFVTGLTRNMNLGTAGIVALGAYASALLYTKLGVSPWIGILCALLVGFIIGLVLGYPSLRIRGVYLSLTTIAFGEIVRLVLNNTTNFTGGAQGVRDLPGYSIFGLKISKGVPVYYLLLVFALVIIWISTRIVNSKWGRAFKSISDNPDAAESLGINIAKLKLTAFTLAAMYAALGGALYAHLMGYINPATFNFDMSIKFVIMMMVGGIGLIRGNIIGAIIVTLLPEALRFLGDYYQLVFYIVAFLGAVFLPEGWPTGVAALYRRIVKHKGKQEA